jgi:hypothetical protein
MSSWDNIEPIGIKNARDMKMINARLDRPSLPSYEQDWTGDIIILLVRDLKPAIDFRYSDLTRQNIIRGNCYQRSGIPPRLEAMTWA